MTQTSYPDAPHFVQTGVIITELHNGYSKAETHEMVFNRRRVPDDVEIWHKQHGLEVKDDALWKCKTINHKKSDPNNKTGSAYKERHWSAGYSFADPKMAMLFKLTFGGAA